MGGNPKPAIRPNDLAHRFGRKVVLPDVDAVEIGGETKVGAIIHDEANMWRGRPPRQPAQFPSLFKHQASIP
jgi:hypothetical protein